MPLVSVLMSVHKAVSPVDFKKSIDSVLAQTLADFEFVIIVDGPIGKELRESLAEFARRDRRVQVHENEENKGLPYCLNRAIRLSTGAYLGRMDSDDISAPDRFRKQVDYLAGHPDCEVVGSYALEIDGDDSPLFEKKLPTESAQLRRMLARRDPFVHPTVMFRRSFFERVGMYDESREFAFLEDTELWCRAFSSGVVGTNIPEFLLKFRVAGDFYQRRRGFDYGLREFRLRYRYLRRMGLPIADVVPMALLLAARSSPAWLLRLAYRFGR